MRSGAAAINRRRLLKLGAATLAVAASGLVAARWVRSPQQVLADEQPPPPTTLTASVERRVLRDTVVLRGQVGAGGRFEVTPAPRDAERTLVSAVRVAVGTEFSAGKVLLEVSGRPLVALRGHIPAYRDLRPGATGKDVTQLQAALKSLGFDPREAAGTLGAGTKRALTAYYDALGYPVPLAGDPLAVAAAGDRVRASQRTLAEAAAELARLRASPPPSPDPQGRDPIAEARTRVRYAQQDLDAAKAALRELERTTGAMLPVAEVVFLPAFPARVDKLSAVVGAEVQAPLITISSGELVVRAKLNPGQRALLKPGMPVEVTSEVSGTTAKGVVATIGALTPDDTGVRSYPMTVTARGAPFAGQLSGQDVRLTVEAASTGQEVLVVPLSALYAGADGRVAVLRQNPGGKQERVVVTAGASGDGYAAVTATGAELRPGDRVVIGATRATPGQP